MEVRDFQELNKYLAVPNS